MAEDGFLSLQEGDLFPAPAPGRAFMSPSEFAGRGLAPGSVIALSRADRVDLCRVFSRPIAPGAVQPPEPHCFRLRAAAVPAGAAEIKPLSGAPTAERVVLRTPVVLGPDARSLMRSLLVGQPIARGFQLSYAEDYSFLWDGDGALLLEVASAAPAAACVVVGRRTNITFEPPADAPPPAADARGAQPSADGLSAAALALVELMALPHWHPRERPLLLRRGGLPRGLLLSGPPGVGKTFAVRSAVDHCRALFPTELFAVAGGELLALGRGAAEAALRDIFRRARRCEAARAGGCAVIFLDELDAFASKRDGQGGLPPDPAAARLAGQLLVLMDGAAPPPGAEAAAHTIVVGATNRPDALDAALRRPGRFDREIPVAAPAAPERRRILARLSAAPAAAVAAVARDCVGYVAADLAALAREAALGAHARGAAAVEEDDLRAAMARVGASALRALAASVPDTPWSAVGGAAEAKRRLVAAVEWPLRHAEAFQRLRLRPPKGLLLYGPPGCSKTTLARAAATASAAAFVALSGADVYSPFVGEAERTVRDAFATARRAAPCVLFFDEIDALVGSRGIGGGGGGAGGAAEDAGARRAAERAARADAGARPRGCRAGRRGGAPLHGAAARAAAAPLHGLRGGGEPEDGRRLRHGHRAHAVVLADARHRVMRGGGEEGRGGGGGMRARRRRRAPLRVCVCVECHFHVTVPRPFPRAPRPKERIASRVLRASPPGGERVAGPPARRALRPGPGRAGAPPPEPARRPSPSCRSASPRARRRRASPAPRRPRGGPGGTPGCTP